MESTANPSRGTTTPRWNEFMSVLDSTAEVISPETTDGIKGYMLTPLN